MKRAKEYLLEFAVIFLSISIAFLSENWREQLQEREDYNLILDEIHANLLLDSIEFWNDISFIDLQISSINRLLDKEHSCPADSLEYHFQTLMYNFRWPDIKSTGIDQLRNSKNLDPSSGLISEVNNYYTWTEYLKESTPYQYIIPQNAFNEWLINNGLDPSVYDLSQMDEAQIRQLQVRLQHLKKTKQLQSGIYKSGLSRIVSLLRQFDQRES